MRIIAALLLACIAAIGIQQWRVSHYKAEIAAITLKQAEASQHTAELAVKASEAAREVERTQAAAFDLISKQNEQDKTDAQAEADRVAADLRTGNLRLRDRWVTQGLATSVAASAGKPDAGADDRAASAGRIVRAARDADDQIRGLQAVLRAERQSTIAH